MPLLLLLLLLYIKYRGYEYGGGTLLIFSGSSTQSLYLRCCSLFPVVLLSKNMRSEGTLDQSKHRFLVYRVSQQSGSLGLGARLWKFAHLPSGFLGCNKLLQPLPVGTRLLIAE